MKNTLVALMLMTTVAVAQEDPLRLDYQVQYTPKNFEFRTACELSDVCYDYDPFEEKKVLTFTAAVDRVLVTSIKVNRGNCVFRFPEYEAEQMMTFLLNFGEKQIVYLNCEPLEVVVVTDVGTYEYKW